MKISRTLAEFSSALAWDAIPAEVRTRAKHLILDAIGCALAAKRFDFAEVSLRAITELGGTGGRGVVGHAQRLPLRDAVLANGILMHGLDYDDTHSEGIVHLTVGVLPAERRIRRVARASTPHPRGGAGSGRGSGACTGRGAV